MSDWLPNVSLDDAFKKWPKLKSCLPIYCGCGILLSPKEVVITQDFIKLRTEDCNCEIYGCISVGFYRSERARIKWQGLLEGGL